MDVHSPPKRMTRSRAAAKATEASAKTSTTSTARAMTAASKAKAAATVSASSSATSSTRVTSAKRKTRADDGEDADGEDDAAPAAKTARPRTRARRVAEPAVVEPVIEAKPAPARATRATRTTRKAAAPEPTPAVEEDTARPRRGRPRKATQQNEEPQPEPAAEPVKAATRSKATTTMKATTTKATTAKATTTRTTTTKSTLAKPTAAKSTVKKTVTFEEPEKENIVPVANKPKKADDKTTTGIRGRPVRRPAAATTTTTTTTSTTSTATTRATRGTRATRATATKIPLSPKKVTQLSAPRDIPSEDELALGDKTPLRKSPIKPPSSSILVKEKKAEVASSHNDETATTKSVSFEEPEAPPVAFASPAKRPPHSPYRDAMKSPAKRSDTIQLVPSSTAKPSTQQTGATPLHPSLMQSPAKRPQCGIKSLAPSSATQLESSASSGTPFRSSLLQTPARRPMSAIKAFSSIKRDPAETPVTKPTILSTPLVSQAKPSELLMDGEEADMTPQDVTRNLFAQPLPSLKFPGRLSAVLPRDANPDLDNEMSTVDEVTEDSVHLIEQAEAHEEGDGEANEEANEDVNNEPQQAHGGEARDIAEVDDEDHDMSDAHESPEPEQAPAEIGNVAAGEPASPATTTPPNSPPKALQGYGLRQRDLNPYQGFDDESEDELTSSLQRNFSQSPARSTPFSSRRISKAPAASSSGFTPLVSKFKAWSTGTPVQKAKVVPATPGSANESPRPESEADENMTRTPMEDQTAKQSFFDEEMLARERQEIDAVIEAAIMADIDAQIDPIFGGMRITAEDVELAVEAEEMSLMDEDEVEEAIHGHDPDETLSETSQDYGDENQVPQDHEAHHREHTSSVVPPQTPARMITKSFHTVSKVPLKPADDSTPSPMKKRRHSVSRLPVQRPAGVQRSASVISYTPTKGENARERQDAAASVPNTPGGESDIWSTMGTPPRSPHKNLDPALLRGAVAYVDVHTSEGADASGIFVELLTQMGARCVKNWSWNPNGASGNDSSKIGITHVVYKDGGKRTLEKVRESGGVVQCVGVAWVLDCERENKWLDEAPYYCDTSLVPRGGARRRKSMEPKALANLNGTLVTGPAKPSREAQTAPNTPMNRRDSTVWMRTPPEQSAHDGEGEDDDFWDQGILTPVPKTPAPEAIARYIDNISPDTPGVTGEVYDEDDDEAAAAAEEKRRELLTRTCPPKKLTQLGMDMFSPFKDPQVAKRLMDARRKSLQFAPKVGSPLSKAWK